MHGHMTWRWTEKAINRSNQKLTDRGINYSDAGRDWGQEEKGTTEDEMAGWHHRLDGGESEWTLGVGNGQGGLVCCDSWGRKKLDTTERLNWIELNEGINQSLYTCSHFIKANLFWFWLRYEWRRKHSPSLKLHYQVPGAVLICSRGDTTLRVVIFFYHHLTKFVMICHFSMTHLAFVSGHLVA